MKSLPAALFLSSLLAIALPYHSQAAVNIGVLRSGDIELKIFGHEDGSILDSQTLSTVLIDQLNDYNTADLNSASGVEWVNNDEGLVNIYSQLGDLLDSFSIFEEESLVGIGNLSDDYAGNEIVVCKKYSQRPRLKVYAYSEDAGATQILSLQPFGSGTHYTRGCKGLAIGDTDGDATMEIIAIRQRGSDQSKVKIFDDQGQLVDSFLLPNQDYVRPSIRGRIFVNDVTGDDADEIVFQNGEKRVFVYTGRGEKVYSFNANRYNDKDIKKIDVADIDNDGISEVVVQEKGKKVSILILSADGEVETHYNLYPDATHNAARFMFLGDFNVDL